MASRASDVGLLRTALRDGRPLIRGFYRGPRLFSGRRSGSTTHFCSTTTTQSTLLSVSRACPQLEAAHTVE